MKLAFTIGTAACLAAIAANAQTFMTVPEDSQRAVVGQRIGVTDVTVVYHRPVVRGRKVWGALVPYDRVWRAGANENTTIEFSSPVAVEKHPLAKGIYGLHMIPSAAGDWTVIFSKQSGDWGSFNYEQADDALRVTVKPQPGEMHEALVYDFDALTLDSATLWMRWEKMAVPIRIRVDTPAVTVASLREEMRGGKQYDWKAGEEAASYCLGNQTNLEEALRWADQSIQYEARFENMMTKSRILAALHRDSEAAAVRAKAMEAASVVQIYSFARQLQMQDHNQAGAMEIFRNVVKRAPDSLQGHLAQARLAVASGDFTTAVAQMRAARAVPGNPSDTNQVLEGLVKRLEAKEDINK